MVDLQASLTADSKRVAADNMAMSADPVIDAAGTIVAIRKKSHTGGFYKLVARDRRVSDVIPLAAPGP